MIQEFVNYLAYNKGYAQGTLTGYEQDLHTFAKWLKESTQCRRWSLLTAAEVDDYVTMMSTNGIGASTIKRRISAIRSFLTWQRQKGMRTDNPAQYVSTPKKCKPLPKTVDTAAISRALNDWRIDTTTRFLIAVMTETGMRISEVLDMKWKDINTAAQSIRVHGKGKKERTTYYGNRTAQYISMMKKDMETPVFAVSYRQARYNVHRALARHTADHRGSCHQLRHTYACEMTKNGMTILDISTLLGHESVQTTEIYAQACAPQLKAKYIQFKPQV